MQNGRRTKHQPRDPLPDIDPKPEPKPDPKPTPSETIQAPQIVSVQSIAKKKITAVQITVEAVQGATGYQIYRKKGSKVTMIGQTSGTVFLDQNPVSGKSSYYAKAIKGSLTRQRGQCKEDYTSKSDHKSDGKSQNGQNRSSELEESEGCNRLSGISFHKEKWQLSEDRSAEKRNEMHIHRQKRTEKRNEIPLPYRDSEKENLQSCKDNKSSKNKSSKEKIIN